MIKNKHRILCVLFSIYFSVYCVSPLYYTYKDRQLDKAGFSTGSIKLQLLLSLNQKESQDSGSLPLRIMLKKKRATLSSEDKYKIPKTLAKLGVIPYIKTSPERTDGIFVTHNHFRFLIVSHTPHSGLSPPMNYFS